MASRRTTSGPAHQNNSSPNGQPVLYRTNNLYDEMDLDPAPAPHAALANTLTNVEQLDEGMIVIDSDAEEEPARSDRGETESDPVDLTNDSPGLSPRRVSQSSTSNDGPLDDHMEFDSDSDVQILSIRKCLKTRKKKIVRRVLDPNKRTVEAIVIDNIAISKDECVEFDDGTFMQIRTIYADRTRKYILVGKVYTRIGDAEFLMPGKRDSMSRWETSTAPVGRLPRYYKGSKFVNEVCQRIRTAAGESKDDEGLWRRSAEEVKCRRKLQILDLDYEDSCVTTQHVNEFAVSEDQHEENIRSVERNGELRCRWKETITHDEYGKVTEHRLERLSPHEILSKHVASAKNMSKAWRGVTQNLVSSRKKPTMLDAFCGCGGMTSAAEQSGIEVKMAFDFDANKIATHNLNFPDCGAERKSVSDWIEWAQKERVRVDILHLSPPCQPFSPANTTPNIPKNEANQATLLACGDVIKCGRPRIVTIEESPGIVNRHGEWFNALIHQFTEMGFSVRWACLECSEYGVPQLRKRVFLIASAPGEDLPPFPKPTHIPETLSIQKTLDALEAIHRVTPLTHHDPGSLIELSRALYDPQCLAKTVTCKGGENYHPSGRRQFTIREYLALQTFPNRFRFPMTVGGGRLFPVTEMRTQLGNAVPPLVGRAILKSVVKSLLEHDEKELVAFGGENEANAIEL